MAEEILKITKSSEFYLQGNLISTRDVGNLNDYLTQLLGLYVTLEDGIILSELVHALYGLNKFIKDYFSEDYEVARAFATTTKFDEKIKALKINKTFSVESDEFLDEDEYVYILPNIEFLESTEEEKGFEKLGDVPVVIDDNLVYDGEEFSFKKKTKFTLLEIMECVFEEVVNYVKDGKNIKS